MAFNPKKKQKPKKWTSPMCALFTNFYKFKYKTLKYIVYQFPCNDCNGIYIGQTSQYLENRIRSHRYDRKNLTALTKHEEQKNHKFNSKDAKILKTENQQKKRILNL